MAETTATSDSTFPTPAETPPAGRSADMNAGNRSEILDEIRGGRRLDKIVNSIENFLNNQVAKLERALAECEHAVENDRIVQEVLERHEREKQKWEEERTLELTRLSDAGEELARAWEKLEEERRNWLENRDRADNRKAR